MWNLLAGYSGLISLCPAAFVGLAGYTMAILTWLGWPYYVGIILGSIAAAVFAALISVPAFRLRGIYFAIGTLVVPEILRYVFTMWAPVGKPVYGGGAGYTVKGLTGISPAKTYWLGLAVAIASVLLMRYILRSKLGSGLAAIRDNDATAAHSGINVFKLKLSSFVIAAFITGMAGAVFYVYQGYIEPASAFSVQWLVITMLATVIGGEGTEEGPLVGSHCRCLSVLSPCQIRPDQPHHTGHNIGRHHVARAPRHHGSCAEDPSVPFPCAKRFRVRRETVVEALKRLA